VVVKSRADYNAELMDFLFGHFTDRLNQTVPSWQIRDGAKHLEIEVFDAVFPDPFPRLSQMT
jgi:hypothetical protein